MADYPIAANEEQRIATLHELRILDSSPEHALDQITGLASAIFNIPTVLISLVDTDRQWFKSRCGLDAEQTERKVAFCNYTIMQEQIFEVIDPFADARFSNNPLVTGEFHLRYYAGAPILIRGQAIGAFCMLDYEPRPALTQRERTILLGLADITARSINERRLLRESTALISELSAGT